MVDGQSTEDTFTFQIQLESTSGELVDYIGPYYLLRDGNYYYYNDNGDLVSNGHEAKICGNTENGQVSGIKVEDTVIITGLLSGTKFKVWETDLGITTVYNTPEYDVKEGTAGNIYVENGENGFASGTILLGKDKDAEVTVTNSEKPIPIDLKKYGSDEYTTTRDGAVFSLFEGTLESSEPMKISWSGTAMVEYENIPVNNEDGKNELTTLTSGYYMLKEVTAPVGYELLDEAIYFQIDEGTVKLITQNGNEITDNKTEMWKLEVENGTVVLKIKNKALYELPSAGGSGIFLYMIGGTLLLIAGSLMIYINRRRGVLRR